MMNPPFRDWPRQRVWIIGASSGIGEAVAMELIRKGSRVAVSARRRAPLDALAAASGDRVLPVPLDVTRPSEWQPALDAITGHWGGVDLALFLAGSYTPTRAWELDAEQARRQIDINVMGVINGLSVILPQLERQGHGAVAVAASVAGYGGLPKALIYGATKAALINLAETLYLDLAPRGIGVHIINPGFVRTPLTDQNDFRMPALQEPEQAARAIVRGLEKGRFEIAFPRRFTLPMKALRCLPRRLYFPLIHKVTGL